MDEPTHANDPLISVRLSTLLKILWGYRDYADRRDKCVPPADVAAALRAVPPDIAKQHFHLQPGEDGGLPFVWHIDEWRRSGHPELQRKEESKRFNYTKDSLTEWLMANGPAPLKQDKVFTANIVNQVVRQGTFELFKVFGLSDDDIARMKENKTQ